MSERVAQEHKDQIMIQKSLNGAVEPEEQAKVDRIDRQHNAKNRGEAIQMPPLHEALVEVHREYEKAGRSARDMAYIYIKRLRQRQMCLMHSIQGSKKKIRS